MAIWRRFVGILPFGHALPLVKVEHRSTELQPPMGPHFSDYLNMLIGVSGVDHAKQSLGSIRRSAEVLIGSLPASRIVATAGF